jgi:hypothetical protein
MVRKIVLSFRCARCGVLGAARNRWHQKGHPTMPEETRPLFRECLAPTAWRHVGAPSGCLQPDPSAPRRLWPWAGTRTSAVPDLIPSGGRRSARRVMIVAGRSVSPRGPAPRGGGRACQRSSGRAGYPAWRSSSYRARSCTLFFAVNARHDIFRSLNLVLRWACPVFTTRTEERTPTRTPSTPDTAPPIEQRLHNSRDRLAKMCPKTGFLISGISGRVEGGPPL